MWLQDVDRTLPDYAFFNREQSLGRLHHAAISRVLFIYAKLNPGIRYVQVGCGKAATWCMVLKEWGCGVVGLWGCGSEW